MHVNYANSKNKFLGRILQDFVRPFCDRSGVSDLSVRAHDSQFMIFGSSRSVIFLSFCHRQPVIVMLSLSVCHDVKFVPSLVHLVSEVAEEVFGFVQCAILWRYVRFESTCAKSGFEVVDVISFRRLLTDLRWMKYCFRSVLDDPTQFFFAQIKFFQSFFFIKLT